MLTAAAIQFGLQLATAIPQMVQAGIDIADAYQAGATKMQQLKAEKRDPTPAEWDAINHAIDGKLEELNAAG
jgi:hypothetical protein